MLPTVLALVLALTDAFACCDHATDPDSCWPLANAADSSACDPAAEWALCQVDGPLVVACEPVALYCCAATAGVGWLDACEQYMPGTQCGGVVMAR